LQTCFKCFFVDDKTNIPSGSKGGLDYWWVETAVIQTHCSVATLAWNNDSFRLLTAGDVIQLWEYKQIGKFYVYSMITFIMITTCLNCMLVLIKTT
jgi:hypothetical protein